MPTKPKIKLCDDVPLRDDLERVCVEASDASLAEWSVELAKRALRRVGIDWDSVDDVRDGFRINERRRAGLVRAFDVREAGFRIHRLAKAADGDFQRVAYRVAGHAVGTGHMREHALVASDYSVKLVNLLSPDDETAARKERVFQIRLLKEILARPTGAQPVKFTK